jgi:hypothetical protein
LTELNLRPPTPDDGTFGGRPETGILPNFAEGFVGGLKNTSVGLLLQLNGGDKRYETSLSQSDFKGSFYDQAGVRYEPGMTWRQAQNILDAQSVAQRTADITSRATTAGAVAQWAGGFAGGIFDPINLIGGEAFTASKSLLMATLKSGALQAGLELGISTPLQYFVAKQNQQSLTASDIMENVAMAAVIGAGFGALGHRSVARNAELSKGLAVGHRIEGVDEKGNVVIKEVAPEAQTLPPSVVEHLPEPAERMTDDQLVNTINDMRAREETVDPTSGEITRPAPIDETHKVVADPETGARTIVDGDGKTVATEAQAEEHVKTLFSDGNIPLRDEVQPQLEAIPGRSAEAFSKRDAALGEKLDANADAAIATDDGVHVPRNGEIDGVLEIRGSEGNEGKVKEVPLEEFQYRTMKKATYQEGMRRKATDIIANRWRRLTPKQFRYVTDWLVNESLLRNMSKELNVPIAPNAMKREIAENLFDKIHGRERSPDDPRNVMPSEDTPPNPDPIKVEQMATIKQKINETMAHYGELPSSEIIDRESGVSNVEKPEDLAAIQKAAAGGIPISELEKSNNPEIKYLLEQAKIASERPKAVRAAMACILGVK